MSRVPIDCPHCGKSTRIDLSLNLSTQKCDRCGVRFSSVDTGLAGSREVQLTEPPEWRRAKTGNWEDDPDPNAPSPPSTATPGSRTAWITVATILLIVAATALTISRRPPTTPPVKPFDSSALGEATTDAAPARPSSYLSLRERIDAASSVASQYLSSSTIEDLLPHIENRAALESQIRAYYSEGEGAGQLPFPNFTLAPTNRQVWIDDLKAVVISYETPGQVPRAVALRQAEDGAWLVDWPSAAAVNDMPLARFRAERDTTPRWFRLLASRDDYFNRAFASDREWVCLRLADPALQHRLYAYARRDSPVGQAVLKSPLSKKGPSSPVRLHLRFPDNSPADDQVEITGFAGMGWLDTDAPDPAAANATDSAPPAPDPAPSPTDQ